MFVEMGQAWFFKAPLGATPRRVEGSMPLLRSCGPVAGVEKEVCRLPDFAFF